jgi:hypothetical protein
MFITGTARNLRLLGMSSPGCLNVRFAIWSDPTAPKSAGIEHSDEVPGAASSIAL